MNNNSFPPIRKSPEIQILLKIFKIKTEDYGKCLSSW